MYMNMPISLSMFDARLLLDVRFSRAETRDCVANITLSSRNARANLYIERKRSRMRYNSVRESKRYYTYIQLENMHWLYVCKRSDTWRGDLMKVSATRSSIKRRDLSGGTLVAVASRFYLRDV